MSSFDYLRILYIPSHRRISALEIAVFLPHDFDHVCLLPFLFGTQSGAFAWVFTVLGRGASGPIGSSGLDRGDSQHGMAKELSFTRQLLVVGLQLAINMTILIFLGSHSICIEVDESFPDRR